jgi:hypothetical protein
MSLDQCLQQCPYGHRLEYVRLSTMFLLPSGQHCDPVVYQLMLDCCIVVSWKVGLSNACAILSFSLRLFQSARVRRLIGGIFGRCSGEGTVGSSCVRGLPREGVT